MTWEEWEQLKADAAERGSTQMQLNYVPGDTGPGSGGPSEQLKSDKKVWAKVGGDVKGVKDDVVKAVAKLSDGQAGLGDTAGCQSAAAQKELYDSWKKYVDDVSTRCGDLGGLLEQSGHDLAKPDSLLREELEKIQLKYRDTEAVGGQAKGK
jgi:hypothetical protein